MMRPHLGDIIGEPPAPMQPVYVHPRDARCFVRRGVHLVLAIIGAVVFGGVFAIHLVMLFAYFPAAPFAG